MATHQKRHPKNNTRGKNKELVLMENEGEEYAKVEKILGDGRFQVIILKSNISVVASLRGLLKKGHQKSIIRLNAIVLIQKDDYSSKGKYYILHAYSESDVMKLNNFGELTIKTSINVVQDIDDDVDFDDNFINQI